jgi:pyridoxamine 5'-phosphate oxidase family protein
MTTMTFTASELSYLGSQPIGRLATVRQDGSPQVSPVGFNYNEEFGTIDIGGFNMSNSRKYHNVMHNDRVAFVVDDVASKQPWRVRCLEIRGTAEVVPDPGTPTPGHDSSLIRIRPRRIISFGIEHPDQEPHLMTSSNRDVD